MANSANKPAQDDEAVRCLVVPVEGLHLLVPNTTIAEVVSYREPAPLNGAAPWMLGTVEWRGLRVPLLAFEVFAGLTTRPAVGASRMVIFNTLKGNANLPFVAVASQGIPRAVRVGQGSVQQSSPASEPGIACRLGVAEVSLAIPDLDAIEDALAQGGIAVTRDGD